MDLTPEQIAAENEAWAWYIARRKAMADGDIYGAK